jgi:hypothetical protein
MGLRSALSTNICTQLLFCAAYRQTPCDGPAISSGIYLCKNSRATSPGPVHPHYSLLWAECGIIVIISLPAPKRRIGLQRHDAHIQVDSKTGKAGKVQCDTGYKISFLKNMAFFTKEWFWSERARNVSICLSLLAAHNDRSCVFLLQC